MGFEERYRRRTPLEYSVMCLVARRPSTGYEITRLLQEYPLAGRGKSPGAIYPALERLVQSGLVQSRRRVPRRVRTVLESSHGRWIREHGLTRAGVVELRRWATGPVTGTEMLERPEQLLLRFSVIIGLAGGQAAQRFVREYRQVARRLAEDLSASMGLARDASPTARLWMELSLQMARVRLLWARKAEAEFERRLAGDPVLCEGMLARNTRTAMERLPPEVQAALAWPHGERSPGKPPGRVRALFRRLCHALERSDVVWPGAVRVVDGWVGYVLRKRRGSRRREGPAGTDRSSPLTALSAGLRQDGAYQAAPRVTLGPVFRVARGSAPRVAPIRDGLAVDGPAPEHRRMQTTARLERGSARTTLWAGIGFAVAYCLLLWALGGRLARHRAPAGPGGQLVLLGVAGADGRRPRERLGVLPCPPGVLFLADLAGSDFEAELHAGAAPHQRHRTGGQRGLRVGTRATDPPLVRWAGSGRERVHLVRVRGGASDLGSLDGEQPAWVVLRPESADRAARFRVRSQVPRVLLRLGPSCTRSGFTPRKRRRAICWASSTRCS